MQNNERGICGYTTIQIENRGSIGCSAQPLTTKTFWPYKHYELLLFHVNSHPLKEYELIESSLCNHKPKPNRPVPWGCPRPHSIDPATFTRECPKVVKSCAATPLVEATASFQPRLRPARRVQYSPVAIPASAAI